ncbi:uncharacterized protein A1O9_02227 [Exophiala aquamarina CBS 119918]|uniref:Xylanolytic transcriptional activator regulatory domain-containing protein n=1 Tax=Exophiala aquamarina CBS 119918 TaxID=1182545 RepID=A0A072PLA7_9EURO|nr:uncharacterized protein A1O9_02227 [Exophiala aquamarina CBS 119918]KEF60666.1 hypothetical protein A1O9_02227 [Exophiala aquamarina CBS 119918]
MFLAEVSASSMSPRTADFASNTATTSATTRSNSALTPGPSRLSTHFGEATSTSHGTFQVPDFVAKPSKDVDPEDLAHLAAQGVFDLPPAPFLRIIFECFLNYVYPLLPILDICDLLHSLYGHTSRVSLPLLYGIMLAASAFVDQSTLDQTGHQSRFAWRSSLGRKLRLLYDFDYEHDRLATVQALLLMTYFHDKPDESKHLLHKIVNAKHLALTIGLNGDFGQEKKLDPRRRRLWKRVWWCCYIRDRTCALGLRQYPTIEPSECQWTDLELEDFDITPTDFTDYELLADLGLQSQLAEICIAQVQLWHLLSDIMHTRFQSAFPRYGFSTETTLILMPIAPQANRTGIEDRQRSLDQWFAHLPDQYAYRLPLSPVFEQGHRLLRLHCCTLALLYNALQCTLNRWALSPSCKSSRAGDITARQKARSSANMILSIFEYLRDGDMVQYTPGWAVTILMQAALTFKTESRVPHSQSGRRLQDCMDVLGWLKDAHFHSNFGISLIDAFLNTADLASTTRPGGDPVTSGDAQLAFPRSEAPHRAHGQSCAEPPFHHEPGPEDSLVTDTAAAAAAAAASMEPSWLADFLEQEFWPQDSGLEILGNGSSLHLNSDSRSQY